MFFSSELLDKIVREWNLSQGWDETEPIDGDEMNILTGELKSELNVHQGNSKSTKFYTYRQNNSGGRWDGPLYVSVEADSEQEAEEIAQENGVYFDGCRDGRDCSCCGDRWYRMPEENDFPGYYEEPLDEFCSDKSQYLIVRKTS